MVKFTALHVFLSIFSTFFIFFGTSLAADTVRSFTIDYENNSFSMDGKPFRYVAGSIHYFRVPHQYWRDRLRKIKAAGLNAISTYVEWSLHESTKGHFSFKGDLNVKKFIKMAQEEGLYVILRPGPYICAERDFGGLPYWLLRYRDIELRTNDKNYNKHVEIWIDVLMKKLSPLLYGKGGPIIMVQVENEYGSFPCCDYNHTMWLRDLFKKHVNDDAVLFTTDGPSDNMLKCGKIPGVYATVDFGPNVNITKAFEAQRRYEPKGPLVNSEFYPGWLTHWGEKAARTETSAVVKALREMLNKGANVNFYMFYGGTNFGFTAGANMGSRYEPDITSYDYDAPLTEAGDITDKYKAVRDVLFEFLPPNDIKVKSLEKGDYGEVTLNKVATLFSPVIREKLGVSHFHENPMTFEELDFDFGYVLYETQIPTNSFGSSNGNLVIKKVRDFAHVYKNGKHLGNMSRELNTDTLEVKNINEGGTLSVIVENLGRINFGAFLNDPKGILSPVSLNKRDLKNWNMTRFGFKNLDAVVECGENSKRETNEVLECDNGKGFVFYYNTFVLPEEASGDSYPLDSFLDVTHLTKGLVFVNGFNLGRYWSLRGPQYTLYVPGVHLKPRPQENVIVVMEETIKTDRIKIKFTTRPIFT